MKRKDLNFRFRPPWYVRRRYVSLLENGHSVRDTFNDIAMLALLMVIFGIALCLVGLNVFVNFKHDGEFVVRVSMSTLGGLGLIIGGILMYWNMHWTGYFHFEDLEHLWFYFVGTDVKCHPDAKTVDVVHELLVMFPYRSFVMNWEHDEHRYYVTFFSKQDAMRYKLARNT